MVIAPGRQEGQLITDAAGDREAEDVAVEGHGAVELGHLEVDMADLGAWIDRRVHASHSPAPVAPRHWGHPRSGTPYVSRVQRLEEREGEIAAVERVLADGGGGLLIEGPAGDRQDAAAGGGA